MYELQLEWKEFNISLPMIEAKMRAEQPSYTGCSADVKLRLHFSEEPSQEAKDAILAYWEALDEESDEAETYAPNLTEEELKEKRDSAKQVKLAMVSKTWANMNALERKLCMGLDEEVSLQELRDFLAE